MSDTEAIVRWLVTLALVSAALAPLIWWLADGLDDVAHGAVRPLAPFLATALLWWPAALIGVPFTRVILGLVVVLGGSAAWFAWLRSGRTITWRPVIAFEAVWLALFAGYALFRSYHPDIANTEKPMDIALLSAVSRADAVPAPDPWFAGEAINYYYFGYQTIGAIVKLSGVPPSIAFNLALATLFASVGTVAAAIGYRLVRAFGASPAMARLAAALAAFLVLLAGNLETAWQLLRHPRETLELSWWFYDVGWEASRVIVDHGVHGNPNPRNTINEFPAFSFVLGDLHPHVLTFPLLAGLVAIVVGMLCKPQTVTLARTAVVGALSGLLYVSNSWDAPLGGGLLVLVLLITFGITSRTFWIHAGAASLAALASAFPFLLDFTAPVGVSGEDIPSWLRWLPLADTLGIVTWRPSDPGEIIRVHGAWIAGFVLFAALTLSRDGALRARLVEWRAYLLTTLAIAAVLSAIWAPALLLLGVPLVLAVLTAVTVTERALRVTAVLFGAGFLLTLIPEFIYIQDAFGDRMNTVFKLYFQAWLLLALATAATFAIGIATSRGNARLASAAVAILVGVAVLPYTPISARDWTNDFADRQGLDGAGYIDRAAPDEYAALAWLRDNAGQSAILVEGPGCSYGSVGGVPMNRFSAFTGFSTIVGWDGHQRQWRRGEDASIATRVTERQEFANHWLAGEMSASVTIPEPDFVILGLQERRGSESCEPLQAHDVERSRFRLEAVGWESVFSSGDVVILARPEANSQGFRD